MSASISRYLTDFSAPKIDRSLMSPKYFSDPDDAPGGAGLFAMQPQSLAHEPAVDVEAERAEAFEEGRQAAEAELGDIHARALADLSARHLADLEGMRLHCENEIATMICDRFSDLGSRLAGLLCDQTARVLAPVMEEALTRKSIDDLARMIEREIGTDEQCRILVKGPATLFDALKRRLSDETIAFRHIDSTDIDLTVEVGNAILVTRMAAWAETVRKVLA